MFRAYLQPIIKKCTVHVEQLIRVVLFISLSVRQQTVVPELNSTVNAITVTMANFERRNLIFGNSFHSNYMS